MGEAERRRKMNQGMPMMVPIGTIWISLPWEKWLRKGGQ